MKHIEIEARLLATATFVQQQSTANLPDGDARKIQYPACVLDADMGMGVVCTSPGSGGVERGSTGSGGGTLGLVAMASFQLSVGEIGAIFPLRPPAMYRSKYPVDVGLSLTEEAGC